MLEEFCAQHDQAEKRVQWHPRRNKSHGAYLQVTGDTPIERTWRLGPARNGVWYRNERRIDTRHQ